MVNITTVWIYIPVLSTSLKNVRLYKLVIITICIIYETHAHRIYITVIV